MTNSSVPLHDPRRETQQGPSSSAVLMTSSSLQDHKNGSAMMRHRSTTAITHQSTSLEAVESGQGASTTVLMNTAELVQPHHRRGRRRRKKLLRGYNLLPSNNHHNGNHNHNHNHNDNHNNNNNDQHPRRGFVRREKTNYIWKRLFFYPPRRWQDWIGETVCLVLAVLAVSGLMMILRRTIRGVGISEFRGHPSTVVYTAEASFKLLLPHEFFVVGNLKWKFAKPPPFQWNTKLAVPVHLEPSMMSLDSEDELTLIGDAEHSSGSSDEEKKDASSENEDDGWYSSLNVEGDAHYYAFDDDVLRGAHVQPFDGQTGEEITDNHNHCRRTHNHHQSFPNCNAFHELEHTTNVLESDYTYINRGTFREVFAMVHKYAGGEEEDIAIKEILYDFDFGHSGLEYMRMDAVVAERLTASPRTYAIYGYCGLGIISEFFYHGDIEDYTVDGENNHPGYLYERHMHDEKDVDPQNDLTGEQKLVLALDMAEGLADLHGYTEGLIIHGDVQLSQFLLNQDKTRLILNDFNRAEMPLYEATAGVYCRYANGAGHGNWRSPEEYKDLPLTEAVDIWSLGNNFLALLTGLNPLWKLTESGHTPKAQELIKKGVVAEIDPRWSQRSKAEAILVSIIQRCYAYQPEDRPTIFEIVQELETGVAESINGKGQTRGKILQSIVG